jgi:hypothetical protein
MVITDKEIILERGQIARKNLIRDPKLIECNRRNALVTDVAEKYLVMCYGICTLYFVSNSKYLAPVCSRRVPKINKESIM